MALRRERLLLFHFGRFIVRAVRVQDAREVVVLQQGRQDFVGDVAVYLLQQRGYQVDAQYRPEDEEGGQLEHALEHRHALELLAGGQRGKHHQHDYAHEVLDDEDAQDDAGELLLQQPHVVEGLIDNGRRGHRHHAAQENAAHVREAHDVSCRVSYEYHAADNGHRGYHSGQTYVHQLLEAEAQSHREEEENDTDVAPRLDVGHVGYGGKQGDGGPGQQAGHDIAQNDRLLQPLEYDRHDARDDEYDGQVGNDRCYFGHVVVLCLRFALLGGAK